MTNLKGKLTILIGCIVLGAIIGTTAALITHSTAQQQQPEQVVYEDLSDKLLTEFVIVHNQYTPQVVDQRCKEDPNWEPIMQAPSGNLIFLVVGMPDGYMSFGYDPAKGPQAICTIWMPLAQPWEGKTMEETYNALLAQSKNDMAQDPIHKLPEKGLIIYKLTDDIYAVIMVSPDGLFSVSVGFKDYLTVLEDLKDA